MKKITLIASAILLAAGSVVYAMNTATNNDSCSSTNNCVCGPCTPDCHPGDNCACCAADCDCHS